MAKKNFIPQLATYLSFITSIDWCHIYISYLSCIYLSLLKCINYNNCKSNINKYTHLTELTILNYHNITSHFVLFLRWDLTKSLSITDICDGEWHYTSLHCNQKYFQHILICISSSKYNLLHQNLVHTQTSVTQHY